MITSAYQLLHAGTVFDIVETTTVYAVAVSVSVGKVGVVVAHQLLHAGTVLDIVDTTTVYENFDDVSQSQSQ